jgi:chlorophyll synthase
VDAINEPGRVIPSGRMPGRWGFFVAVANTLLSLAVAWWLGPWVFGAATVGLALAWAYSAPPLRLKRSGWYGPAAVGLCYEGLPWFTAAAAASGAFPGYATLSIALLYSVGAHGIMTLNDFKSVEGDRRMGLASLPAVFGVERAARLACFVMAVPQLLVIALLLRWGFPIHASIVAALFAGQVICMLRLLQDPLRRASWYNATGTTMYVFGMLASAFALRAMQGG